ncbi:branched-chain amino acid ABC transporter permease [Halobacterium noricense]|uniref:branched-chain amino acid ABC transporter permease n=1 Tax=Halobacterium noricense TaxID=223182 RepID=UPI001E5D1369|nr:branched-chain amino acid ABC transporter permease [Halobacterium noricense]UHH23976.1 branched-chain amino acid ABC transporter permease [Halobacterium noricense]
MNSDVLPGARKLAFVGLLFVIAPLPILESGYYIGVLSRIVLFALFALALNIVFGHNDQLFLFMGGLGGFGAYTTALIADSVGVSPWIGLPVAALLCGIIGFSVSWISARQRFTVILISILTLNLQLVFEEVFIGARGFTGGSTGFPYELFSLSSIADAAGVSTGVVIYYITLAFLLAGMVMYLWLIESSRYGVAFEAIREDETAAESIGINVVRYKAIAGFVAGVLIAVAGTMLAREASYITPSVFTFLAVDFIALIALIVGGIRRTYGPIVGAVIVELIEAALGTYASSWRTAIFGLLLIVLFLYFRSGVIVAVEEFLEKRDISMGGGNSGDQARAEG